MENIIALIKRMNSCFSNFKNRLFFGLFIWLFSLSASAQVVYKDIAPDVTIYDAQEYALDIDNDGNMDITYYIEESNYAGQQNLITLVSTSETASYAGGNYYASAFNQNDSIGPNLEWHEAQSTYVQEVINVNLVIGPWNNMDRGFLGFRLNIDDQYYYAWVRLYVLEGDYHQLVFADCAYNTVPNEPILAGQGMPVGVTSLIAFDEFDYFDGRDIRVSFNKAFNENLFSEYRLIIAKAEDNSVFDLEYMNQLPEDKYESFPISPIPDNIFTLEHFFISDTKDIDGDMLDTLQDYRIQILNVSISGNPSENVLSLPSSFFHLKKPNLPVENLAAIDINNSNSSGDIQVSFNELQIEAPIQEYRIFVSKEEDADYFNIETALQLSSDYFSELIPQGGYQYVNLKNNQLDIEGNTIENGQFYKVFALSISDSILSKTNVLSTSSRKMILNNPNYLYTGKKAGENVHWFPCDDHFSDHLYWGNEGPSYGPFESYIDVNRDGTNDFFVYGEASDDWTGNRHLYYLRGERNNQVLVCEHENHENWIDVLKIKESIGEGYATTNEDAIMVDYLTHNNSTPGYVFYNGHINGTLWEQDTSYIGLQINDNNVIQYAWIKLFKNIFLEYGFQNLNSGIQNLSSSNKFMFYPNPSKDFLRIESLDPSYDHKDIKIIIYNSFGSEMEEFKLYLTSTRINLSNYSSGLYFFVIKDQGQILETHKVMVE